MGGYVWVVYLQQVHSISWTIPHCVLVLKLIGKHSCVCVCVEGGTINLAIPLKIVLIKKNPSKHTHKLISLVGTIFSCFVVRTLQIQVPAHTRTEVPVKYP